VLAVAAVLAGCGTTEPQAPRSDAKKLDVATSGISASCGLSYQITAFPGPHAAAIANLESTASSFGRKLAAVYRRYPGRIYQGATVAKIVAESESMLSECGLPRAAAALRSATQR
jgi:hypothetical protein